MQSIHSLLEMRIFLNEDRFGFKRTCMQLIYIKFKSGQLLADSELTINSIVLLFIHDTVNHLSITNNIFMFTQI